MNKFGVAGKIRKLRNHAVYLSNLEDLKMTQMIWMNVNI